MVYFHSAMGKAMLIVWAGLGVEIERAEPIEGSGGILCYFSVPKSSFKCDAHSIEMSGKHLASKFKHTLEEMGIKFDDCQYRIRNENWTEADRERAEKVMKNGLINF